MSRRRNDARGGANVVFDPLDPVAMLQAMREARSQPYIHPDSVFEAKIRVINEERLVPLSYQGAQHLQQELEEREEAQRNEEARARQKAVANQRREELQANAGAFAAFRRRMEEQVGKVVLQKVASRGVPLLHHLRELDVRGSGFVSAKDFRSAMKQHQDDLGLSLAECDKLIEQVLEGDLVHYELLQIIPQTRPALERTKSAADLQHESLQELAAHRAQRYQFAALKNHSTSRLLRPATGTEAFFPDEQRLVTTMQRPAEESLSPVRIEKSTKAAASKQAGLQAHLARFAVIQAQELKAAEDRETARQERLVRQREAYLAPFEAQAQRDIVRAQNPRGKRIFTSLPPRLNQKAHQVDQRIGEDDAREAYAAYEARTRTKEWQEVFGIPREVLHALVSRDASLKEHLLR
ncbi:Hypothetical Protein FCC1311_095672 [Hondaea fermentalgiana]|uniref:EF-hand domain-containing protein n=1 Tax=Hondaea fermentalgiana TaxID=2315210 RepID=A0A2R5GZ89_9STRA|nr:Hypothetical Protein FCC1311_095672 [Hondaea fermentalgiana]|eukprot:GBG33344.1 Hypothetical Protein FCC1311_095672 [Hondaea fermentalgiana]